MREQENAKMSEEQDALYFLSNGKQKLSPSVMTNEARLLLQHGEFKISLNQLKPHSCSSRRYIRDIAAEKGRRFRAQICLDS